MEGRPLSTRLPIGAAAVAFAVALSLASFSCASASRAPRGPGEADPGRAVPAAASPEAAPRAQDAEKVLGPPDEQSAQAAEKNAGAADAGRSQEAERPAEVSFPHRKAIRYPFIIAELHEPVPPKKEVPAVDSAKSKVSEGVKGPEEKKIAEEKIAEEKIVVAPTPTPKAEAKEVPKAAKAASASPGKGAPKVDGKEPAAKAAAAKGASSKGAAAAAQKPGEGEPKNASSGSSLAVVSDPGADKKPPARTVAAVEGVRFEIPFEGTGWTYLGDQANKQGVAYDSRRFEDTNLVFVLNPVKAGEYMLRFQRQDSLRGISYEELVAVSVAPKPAAQPLGTALAPDGVGSPAASANLTIPGSVSPGSSPASPQGGPSSSAAPAASFAGASAPAAQASSPSASGARSAASLGAASNLGASPAAGLASAAPGAPGAGGAAGSAGTAAPGGFDPSGLATPEAALVTARAELIAGRVGNALLALDRFAALAPDGSDEAYILYARALEKNGPQKDIRRSYSFYKKLRDDYPESQFWDEASARCSYIERHYFDIR